MRQNMRKDIRKLIDTDADGKLSQTELETADKLHELQNKMEKSETQARMAWMALVGILIFTAFLFSPYVDVARLDAIGEFIGMFYISLAGILATFMGTQAWTMRK